MITPHTILIHRITFALNLLLTSEIRNVSPMNQENEAHATPVINGVSCPAANVTWKAPSIMVPSMIACGLNQVTTQADEMVFLMDMVVQHLITRSMQSVVLQSHQALLQVL